MILLYLQGSFLYHFHFPILIIGMPDLVLFTTRLQYNQVVLLEFCLSIVNFHLRCWLMSKTTSVWGLDHWRICKLAVIRIFTFWPSCLTVRNDPFFQRCRFCALISILIPFVIFVILFQLPDDSITYNLLMWWSHVYVPYVSIVKLLSCCKMYYSTIRKWFIQTWMHVSEWMCCHLEKLNCDARSFCHNQLTGIWLWFISLQMVSTCKVRKWIVTRGRF